MGPTPTHDNILPGHDMALTPAAGMLLNTNMGYRIQNWRRYRRWHLRAKAQHPRPPKMDGEPTRRLVSFYRQPLLCCLAKYHMGSPFPLTV
ncbi:hypothetical protein M430DRAFT_33795 [Amorphotheca resinae ATCC 22711]|uniref:Uncharacterized protein n=1 Tax=Amorphotheca resinae ATCC 22711 TaxID=857342 RepID=A0A2T3B8S9_AMORE|nr:hypothetical protein M430DRAFT_33795 [Amorphotheca resinae ATCC 22711]PSS23253.1 hypothetical protein M430DRAFT_33795 [Amorphotheca resinae ATCC 22711]